MGLMNCSSFGVRCRGYDYYKNKAVINLKQISDTNYEATVKGSGNIEYTVRLDLKHNRQCKCNCPYAIDSIKICKHMIATYFTILPQEADKFYKEELEPLEETSKKLDSIYERLSDYIEKMPEKEVRQSLLSLLLSGPDWQFENFVFGNHLLDE